MVLQDMAIWRNWQRNAFVTRRFGDRGPVSPPHYNRKERNKVSIMENMKKVNFAFDGIKQETKEFEMGGITVTAVNKIPYDRKIECAKFIAARRIMEDEQNPGYAVESVYVEPVEMQAWLMFYTNANVEGMSIAAVCEMYDNLRNDEGYRNMLSFTWDDRDAVIYVTYDLTKALTNRIEAKRSKGFDMSSIFDAFMSDPDPAATIAQNRELNERLIDAMKIAKEK